MTFQKGHILKQKLIGILACGLCLLAYSDELLEGRVAKVADGDTITILVSGWTRSVASVPEKFDRMEVAPHLLHGHIGGRTVNG